MTILSRLQSSVNQEIDLELHELIIQKLLNLFNYLCPFDLSDKDSGGLVFKKSMLENEVLYNFEYGEIRLATYSNKLSVCIFFNSDNVPMIPSGSQWCHINVDDMLNYEKATFQSRFNFGNQIPHHPDNTFGIFSIEKSFNSNLEFEPNFVYSLWGFNSGVIDFNRIKFPKLFFENNNDFHAPLMKMLEYCSKKPDIFYDIFEEYPCHEEMIDNPEEFKTFLRLFHKQYTRSKKILKSNILLLDMKSI